MCEHVYLQISRGKGREATFAAPIRFNLPSMLEHMSFKSFIRLASEGAFCATYNVFRLHSSLVSFLVFPEPLRAAKFEVTLVADERFYPLMCHFMSFQLASIASCVVTFFTPEGYFPSVLEHMQFQIAPVNEL